MKQAALSVVIRSVADLLCGDFNQIEHGRVILPFTPLRRLDCVLAPTKAATAYKRRRLANALEALIEDYDPMHEIGDQEDTGHPRAAALGETR